MPEILAPARDRVHPEVRHFQIAQKQTAVCMRVRTHAARAASARSASSIEVDLRVERLLGTIASQPAFDLLEMLGMLRRI